MRNTAVLFGWMCLLCACGGGLENQATIDQALSDESLLATVALLQTQGTDVDVSPTSAVIERSAAENVAVSFPLKGVVVGKLTYDRSDKGEVKIIVIQPAQPESNLDAVMAKSCGTYYNADTCDYGPWASGQGCSGGPLYKYNNYTRRYYENGRKVSVNYSWYSCTWMAQDPSCTSNCT